MIKKKMIYKTAALSIALMMLAGGCGKKESNSESSVAESSAESSVESSGSTETKESSETPEPTETPETTEIPVPTDTPEPTETPTPTEEPAPTETPYKKYEAKELTTADDKTAPIIISITKNPTLVKGNAFDVTKYISYADDVCRNVKLLTSGEVDINTPGDYPLSIVLKDDAGHETAAAMTVTILAEAPEKKPGGGGTVEREQFPDFLANYKTDNTMVGIDVSKWQDKIDFEKVKAAGCEFVMIRLGGYDDGSTYTDKFFADNIKNAKAAGLKVGLYWHAEESSVEEVKNNVVYLLDVLGGESLDLPIAYDWEDFSKFPKHNMSMYDLNACFEVFCDELHEAGYEGCIYSSKNPLGYMWTNERNHPVWMAHYTKQSNYEGEYFMWQHSCTGRIDGINGDVDLDVLYLDRIEV
ncbi:MAG: glycoside hydrolase family 25 protein [Lachnospiraceae bacterium]|nr:glycoside hydrolase family 25 protein [Lachnospiraceae bacterium]